MDQRSQYSSVRRDSCSQPLQGETWFLEKGVNCSRKLWTPLMAFRNQVSELMLKLLAKFIDKQREKERASGISAEYDELDQLLQEIKDLKEDFEREIAETDEKKKKKLEEDKESADSIRRRSLETYVRD